MRLRIDRGWCAQQVGAISLAPRSSPVKGKGGRPLPLEDYPIEHFSGPSTKFLDVSAASVVPAIFEPESESVVPAIFKMGA